GWKTSQDHWNDNAVWEVSNGVYAPLSDPLAQPPTPLDMAFVITPEPTTLGLLALGGLVVLKRRKLLA
ncbi:MAG: PEP-CTERM sorting domain-containing protein, partial [bacterium]|nr:PEP-CTERM sorting domain-containing protein [bacterium]